MIYMFLADGFEETEALVTLDMMRRAGIEVLTVGIGKKCITGAHNIVVTADILCADVSLDSCEGIVLPGGMPGTENLYASDVVISALDFCMNNSLLVAAICAAPIIIGRKGYLNGKNAVCFPGFENELSGAYLSTSQAVTDSHIITAKGAGCVFEFSHSIISYIKNTAAADKVISDIQHKGF